MSEPSPLAPPVPAPSTQGGLFPLFADLRGRRVLVVGGGAVARRKVEPLLQAGAQVVVGAAALRDAGLRQWVDEGRTN